MKPINLCTLQVRVGKCHLNLKSDGLFAVSLQMGKNISSMSPKKKPLNNLVAFNTTLRMNIDKQLLEQQTSPKCRILLHLIRQNRQKQVIGIATIDIITENNQGFKYHEFGQCADCQADIEVSITCSSSFQLGVRSQIGYFYTSESRLVEGNQMDQSRAKDFIQDSMLDNSAFNLLNRSKAVSNVDWTSLNRPARPSHQLRPRRSSNMKNLRKAKPQNFISRAPQEIITHYETEIKTLEDELRQREEWANGMKQMVQQLQAQNQLLKQIKIEQLQQSNIQNFEEGIDFVSKLVHSKFQASKSAVYDAPITQEDRNPQDQDSEMQNTERRNLEEELKLQLKQTIRECEAQSDRSLTQVKSYKDLPRIIISPRIQCSPLKERYDTRGGQILQSRQDLQNALKILTGGEKTQVASLENVKIQDLQESLFKMRQQKQQLQDMTQQLYEQLTKTKLQRDSFSNEIKELEKQLDRMTLYIEQIDEENQRLKEENMQYEKSSQNQESREVLTQNKELKEKNTELERKLKESLKAIEQFKNDALNARSQLITKDDELNSYIMKFGQLGSMTDVYLNNLKAKDITETSGYKNLNKREEPRQMKQSSHSTTTASTSNLHSLYTVLLQTSVNERKQLQHSLSQIISEKTFGSSAESQMNSRNLKRLQVLINKLFIEVFKNNSQFKNLKEIETTKLQVSRQIQNIIASI